MNRNYIFDFARKFRSNLLALDILEYLVDHNGEYGGTYSDLAERIRGNKKLASNVRHAVMWLMDNGFVYTETWSHTHGTYISVDENWMNGVYNNAKQI